MSPIVVVALFLLFMFFISEIVMRLTHIPSEEIVPEPNGLLEDLSEE